MRKPKRHRRSEPIRRGGDALRADLPTIRPNSGDCTARARDRNNRGFELIGEGHPRRAVVELREAIRLDPRLPGAHNNLGIALQVLGELREATAEYRTAIGLDAGSYPARVNLGNLLFDRLHDYAGAAAEFREAVRLKPGDATLIGRLAKALEWDGRPGEAAVAYDAFVRDFPQAATAEFLFDRGLLKLKLGDFAAGWAGLERRHEAPSAGGIRLPGIPNWHGEPFDGTLVLNSTRDGYGDALMAIRFADGVRRRVREIVLLCRRAEARLLGRCGGIDRVATEPSDLPAATAQATVLGLAAAMGVTPETMPGAAPYLSTDEATDGRWRGTFRAVAGRFNVGISWQGNPRQAHDARRSFRLGHLAPLAAVPGVSLISLQKGHGCEQLADAGFPIVDLGFEYQVGDWLDTAAIVDQLDLVISPDTAICHLAGALGKPVWTALSRPADWRWLLDRDDSPWYPSMRLFRQERPGEWGPVFGRMAEVLRDLAGSPGGLAGIIAGGGRGRRAPADAAPGH